MRKAGNTLMPAPGMVLCRRLCATLCMVPSMTLPLALPAGHAQTTPTEDTSLVCEVAGYDVIILYSGEASIPAGSVLEWSVPFSRSEGHHDLTRDLAPGDRVFLSAVLGSSYLDPGKPCFIAISPTES